MSILLSKCNYVIRNEKKIIQENCIIRKREKLLHVCLNSPGCRFGKAGSCSMCNYGQGYMISDSEMESILQRVSLESDGMNSILIGTLGSIFDISEVPKSGLEIICSKLNEMPINTVIFETHYTFIDEKLCIWLKERMPDKDIVIELGLESSDNFVQRKCLNKIIQLDKFKEKIRLLHRFQMSVTVNVFLGVPFLSVVEQIEDIQRTILWAIRNGADSTVIFPANIRKNTLLDFLYKNQQYRRITQWQVLEVLKKIPINYLNRIFFAWYGDWVDKDENGNIENLPPYSCEQCQEQWIEFYHKFLQENSSEKRKFILDDIANSKNECECRRKFKKDLCIVESKGREKRVIEAHLWLQKHCDI